MHVTVVRAHGGILGDADLFHSPRVLLGVDSPSVVLPEQETPVGRSAESAYEWDHSCSFWPLPADLAHEDLVIKVQSM